MKTKKVCSGHNDQECKNNMLLNLYRRHSLHFTYFAPILKSYSGSSLHDGTKIAYRETG